LIEFKAKSDTGLLLVEVPNCDEIGTVPVLSGAFTPGERPAEVVVGATIIPCMSQPATNVHTSNNPKPSRRKNKVKCMYPLAYAGNCLQKRS
jgi:hypothetical protein